MKRREFLSTVGAGMLATVGGGGCVGAAGHKAARRPNIVLIMADDLGYECLGCDGGASYSTPVLDGLAATGMRFDHCHSQPLCTPSRVKLMTGRCNFRNYKAFGILDPNEITFGHLLQRAGYATGIAGKWQLYGWQGELAGAGTYPDRAGFDDYCMWQIADRGSRYADPMIQRKGGPLEELKGQYGPDVFCDFITAYMEAHREEPFFVYYPMCLVHAPFVPTPDSDAWRDNRNAEDTKYFADMVAYMDKIIGRIVQKTDDLGIRDDTLFLFTGDNGTGQSIKTKLKDGRTIRGGKSLTIDTGTHVPLIANWKGVTPAGAVCDDLISFADFFPTFAEIAGVPLPEDRVLDGRSFLAQLRGEKGDPQEAILCHYDPRWAQRPRARYARDKRWKLYDDGRFFDVIADPLEEAPIAQDQGAHEARAARAMLQRVLDAVK